jgi:hypothetical protein
VNPSYPTNSQIAPVALLACIILASPANAEGDKLDERVPTISELRLLPPYCPDTQIISTQYGRKQSPSEHDAHTKQFVDIYGNDFWHLHHYCFGLTQILRADKSLTSTERQKKIQGSIHEYDYVIRHVSSNSVILPELHMKKGSSLLRLNRGPEAVIELQKAISMDPALVRAYTELCDYYKESGKKDLALKILEDGLTITPDDKAMLRRYAALGGKKTFVKKTERSKAETVNTEPTPQSETIRQTGSTAQEAPLASPSNDTSDRTNPYCRFCP